jgi:hypothetical protein
MKKKLIIFIIIFAVSSLIPVLDGGDKFGWVPMLAIYVTIIRDSHISTVINPEYVFIYILLFIIVMIHIFASLGITLLIHYCMRKK